MCIYNAFGANELWRYRSVNIYRINQQSPIRASSVDAYIGNAHTEYRRLYLQPSVRVTLSARDVYIALGTIYMGMCPWVDIGINNQVRRGDSRGGGGRGGSQAAAAGNDVPGTRGPTRTGLKGRHDGYERAASGTVSGSGG